MEIYICTHYCVNNLEINVAALNIELFEFECCSIVGTRFAAECIFVMTTLCFYFMPPSAIDTVCLPLRFHTQFDS